MLSDRDELAARAMQALISSSPGPLSMTRIADDAYKMADVMIAARGDNRPQPTSDLFDF